MWSLLWSDSCYWLQVHLWDGSFFLMVAIGYRFTYEIAPVFRWLLLVTGLPMRSLLCYDSCYWLQVHLWDRSCFQMVAIGYRFTYEIAPVFTLMEDIVLTKMRELIGWQDGDGIFAPGGLHVVVLTLTTLKYFCINHGDQRVLFNLKTS